MNTTTTPAEPPVGTLVRDRHGAIHRRYADGWGEEFDRTYHLGVWAAIWEAAALRAALDTLAPHLTDTED